MAALKAAIAARSPPAGCVHYSDRGSQYAAEAYRKLLAAHGLVGSMGRRGTPYDNAKAKSFIKTLKVEAVYPMAYKSFEDAARHLARFIEDVYNRAPLALGARLSEPRAVRGPTDPGQGQNRRLILSGHPGPRQLSDKLQLHMRPGLL